MRALEVAAAQVHGQRHAGGFLCDDLVDELGVPVGQFIGVVPALAGGFTHFFVTEVGQVGVVHLDIGTTRGGQAAQLVAVSARHVVVEGRIKLGVGLLADAGAAAAEVQHGGGGNRHLGGATRRDLALEVLEIRELDVLGMAHLVNDTDHRWGQLLGAVGLAHGDRDVGLHTAELLEKVDVEVGAPELAVRDALQAHVFLKLHDLGDRLVFHQAQLLGRDLARGLFFARLEQVLGTQEAADVVVAGGKVGDGHGVSPDR